MGKHDLSADEARQLAILAQRLAEHPDFMASVLRAYRQQENLSDEAFAAYLRTNTAMLVRLALCKRPKSNSPQFAQQVRQIAEYTQTDTAALAMIVRQVESLEALQTRPAPEASANEQRVAPRRSGLLAA